MTTRQEQQAFKSWLDGIVEPTTLSQRTIARIGETIIPLNEKQEQLQRVLATITFIEQGKFASAAHVRREWKKHNPWINGEEDAKNVQLVRESGVV